MKWIIIELFILIELSFSLAPNEVLILILSQPDTYHDGLAKTLLQNISNQSFHLNSTSINVKVLHNIVEHPGYWTFLPILPRLEKLGHFQSNIKWIVLCEDRSSVNVSNLIYGLGEQDWTQDIYLGFAIYDKEATIIHHFAFFERPQWFPYPLIRSGIAFSRPLITKLTKRVQEGKPASEFFIDASHELSLYIWQNIKVMTTENNKLKSRSNLSLRQQRQTHTSTTTRTTTSCQESEKVYQQQDNGGDVASKTGTLGDYRVSGKLSKEKGHHKLLMAASPYFCQLKGPECAIYASEVPSLKSTCKHIDIEEIYFAIKTYHKFHSERIPIIEKTWGQYAVHKKYFSDIADATIPTFTTNVPNTENGHCAKTLSIFKLALKDIDEMNVSPSPGQFRKPIKWIFLCDDDTLLSVSRVCDTLGCFDATQHIYLGERYGYRLHSKDGFNYITGGGGMAISLPTARKIVTSCVCPSISSPDDMIIGMCLQRLGIKAIHSSRFHQARPSDYTDEFLTLDEPVSFHKFWQIDPIRTYTKWFQMNDQQKQPNATPTANKSICDIKTGQSTNFVTKSTNGKTKWEKNHHSDL